MAVTLFKLFDYLKSTRRKESAAMHSSELTAEDSVKRESETKVTEAGSGIEEFHEMSRISKIGKYALQILATPFISGHTKIYNSCGEYEMYRNAYKMHKN